MHDCCNYQDGNCLLLNDGEECACPLQVGFITEITLPKKGVRFIAINDGVDSFQRDNDMSALNDLAQSRYRCIVRQMAENESVTEDLKRQPQWAWIRAMNSIVSIAEEIISSEMINT